ncbi:ComEA family DNA-binding protein [Pseudonocardia alaniniphila]|uniref:ComEA family DNA-binding protein n=2 Tax=Pseudonocardia alaniniphila TaxID=75291 RepID=UPI00336D4975
MSSAGRDRRSRAPQELLADRAWRIRHSIWLLGPIVGIGIITWASFLYVGTKASRRDWQIAGGLYAAATAAIFFFTDGTEGPNGKPNEWLGGVMLALWAAGIVHAVLSNKSWLRWRSQNHAPWYAAQESSSPSPPQNHLPPEVTAMGIDAGQYYAPAPPPSNAGSTGITSSPWLHAPGPGVAGFQPPAPPTEAPRPVDVNTTGPEKLAALPGMTPQRIQRVMHERAARRGFTSVSEFADAAGLAPHEHQRIRPLVTCSPPSRGPAPHTGYGRVLDY